MFIDAPHPVESDDSTVAPHFRDAYHAVGQFFSWVILCNSSRGEALVEQSSRGEALVKQFLSRGSPGKAILPECRLRKSNLFRGEALVEQSFSWGDPGTAILLVGGPGKAIFLVGDPGRAILLVGRLW